MNNKYFNLDKLKFNKTYNFRIGYSGEGKDYFNKIIKTLSHEKKNIKGDDSGVYRNR